MKLWNPVLYLIDRHIESVHGSSSSESSCPDCNLESTNNLELSDHMNSMHAQNALTSTDRVMQPTSASSGPASTAISRPAPSSKSGSATAAASESLWLSLISFNLEGFKRNRHYLSDLLLNLSPDRVFLQALWIPYHEKNSLNLRFPKNNF